MTDVIYSGVHPCAFCTIKNTAPCRLCSEQFQMAVLEDDVSEDFLIDRDMSLTEFSGIIPPTH
jgi:hypothetical protein